MINFNIIYPCDIFELLQLNANILVELSKI